MSSVAESGKCIYICFPTDIFYPLLPVKANSIPYQLYSSGTSVTSPRTAFHPLCLTARPTELHRGWWCFATKAPLQAETELPTFKTQLAKNPTEHLHFPLTGGVCTTRDNDI